MPAAPVTLDDVKDSHDRIRAHIHRTPLLHTATLSEMTSTDLWLKAENLQKTGSFKSRGSINVALQLTPEECARGVIAVSAGNHAAGLAFGARMAGSRATLVHCSHVRSVGDDRCDLELPRRDGGIDGEM